jgi:hypothetical protein
MTSNLPADILEQRAAEQRRRLHESVSELRTTVKDRLNVRRNAQDYSRRHLPQASAAAAVIGLALGWVAGGVFTR